jgi:hypothetical protein
MVKRFFLFLVAIFLVAAPSLFAAEKRIKDLSDAATLTTTNYFVTDSGGDGTKRVAYPTLAAQVQTPLRGNVDANGKNIVSPTFTGTVTNSAIREVSVQTLTASGGAISLSWTNNPPVFDYTLSANTTINLANTTGTNRTLTLYLYCDGTHTVDWPAGVAALTGTNQPFAAGLTTVYITRKSGTNYVEVSPDPTPYITGASPTISNPTIVAPTITFPVINYQYPGTNNTSFGLKFLSVTNSGGVSQWDVCYINSSGQLVKASATTAGTANPGIVLAEATTSTGLTCNTLLQGVVRNDSWSWTPGGKIFLGTTAGSMTQTAPATTGNAVQVLGTALTATIIRFFPSNDYGTVQ